MSIFSRLQPVPDRHIPGSDPDRWQMQEAPNRHLIVYEVLTPLMEEACIECGKAGPPPGNCCERCGVPLHDDCYLKMVPNTEWTFYKAWDPDSDVRVQPDAEAYFYARFDPELAVQRGPYIFVCRWCRG